MEIIERLPDEIRNFILSFFPEPRESIKLSFINELDNLPFGKEENKKIFTSDNYFSVFIDIPRRSLVEKCCMIYHVFFNDLVMDPDKSLEFKDEWFQKSYFVSYFLQINNGYFFL
jgi:hypothetical protein